MAILETNGLDEFAFDFEGIALLPDSVVSEMLEAEGDVIKSAQIATAQSMLAGPYNRGGVVSAIRRGKVKQTSTGKAVYVTFNGTQHGNRVAEIAFVNEYGKQGQPARPFIREANERNADKAVDAAAKIYDEFLSKAGF